ncbi:N-acetylmuramidase family protein [Terriglobus albidus]|uniref:N-acetylmuramidase family protein n=2 Tax=Terriglobus albidus TaxID=1592106 RepID=A0A5B9ELR5_9BACT|nr:N-acetylmuramidase family protein [Terriglobus albidus]
MAGAAGGLRLPYRTGDAKLADDDYKAAADDLCCEVRAIKAVTSVEAPRGAYDEFGRPTILFERHLFHRFTAGRHDRFAPDISNANRGGYGKYAAQYDKLQRAYQLDATAALRAASWGAFQILGDNYAQAGFGTVDLFVTAMCQSIQQQLRAFVAFIKFSATLTQAIQNRNWATFARVYNGPAYKDNRYDTNLQGAYDAATP